MLMLMSKCQVWASVALICLWVWVRVCLIPSKDCSWLVNYSFRLNINALCKSACEFDYTNVIVCLFNQKRCALTSSPPSGRSYSKTLQQAPLSILPRRYCQQYFEGAFTSRMLCAGSVQSERRVDSCRGDSGGPLVCERPGGGWVVYGITSWGHACRTQRSPGVYTRVSAFSSWIQKVVRGAGRKQWKRDIKWPTVGKGRKTADKTLMSDPDNDVIINVGTDYLVFSHYVKKGIISTCFHFFNSWAAGFLNSIKPHFQNVL